MPAPPAVTELNAARLPRLAPASGFYRAVVLGCSAGGLEALKAVLAGLPASYTIPLLLVQHLHASDGGRFAVHLDQALPLAVREADDKAPILPGHLYTAPADYHLLVEADGTLALSTDPKVNSSRPAIDVLFESAALAFMDRLVCIVLSGANYDGAAGALLARRLGALVVAQDPATATSPAMPQAAIRNGAASCVLPPPAIGELLLQLEHHRVVEGGDA